VFPDAALGRAGVGGSVRSVGLGYGERHEFPCKFVRSDRWAWVPLRAPRSPARTCAPARAGDPCRSDAPHGRSHRPRQRTMVIHRRPTAVIHQPSLHSLANALGYKRPRARTPDLTQRGHRGGTTQPTTSRSRPARTGCRASVRASSDRTRRERCRRVSPNPEAPTEAERPR
jgi:hypothetical protein